MPPVAAAVSPVRKSRVEKHGRELAVGGSVGHPRHGSVAGRNGNRAVGRERIIRVIRRNRLVTLGRFFDFCASKRCHSP